MFGSVLEVCVFVCVLAVPSGSPGSAVESGKPHLIKGGGSPMFYKDRTLQRMSLRKNLGLGPHVGWLTRPSLSPFSFPHSLSLSLSQYFSLLIGKGTSRERERERQREREREIERERYIYIYIYIERERERERYIERARESEREREREREREEGENLCRCWNWRRLLWTFC